MARHSHNFVETYKGLVGLGFDRETDEKTIIYCLQKFSDDRIMEHLVKRMTDDELKEIFCLMMRLLKSHLSEDEYHRYFIKS